MVRLWEEKHNLVSLDIRWLGWGRETLSSEFRYQMVRLGEEKHYLVSLDIKWKSWGRRNKS